MLVLKDDACTPSSAKEADMNRTRKHWILSITALALSACMPTQDPGEPGAFAPADEGEIDGLSAQRASEDGLRALVTLRSLAGDLPLDDRPGPATPNAKVEPERPRMDPSREPAPSAALAGAVWDGASLGTEGSGRITIDKVGAIRFSLETEGRQLLDLSAHLTLRGHRRAGQLARWLAASNAWATPGLELEEAEEVRYGIYRNARLSSYVSGDPDLPPWLEAQVVEFLLDQGYAMIFCNETSELTHVVGDSCSVK
jgi:hypothetical protein